MINPQIPDDHYASDFEQASFEAAKNHISQLSRRPDLLRELVRDIAETAPPNSLPTRIQPRQSSR